MTQEQKNYMNTVLDMYCINLKRSSDRWEGSVKEFEKYGMSVNRFDAVDGQNISHEELLEQNIVTNNLDHILKNQKGALGIIASSVKLWKEISDRDNDKWCLIMEDDIKMHPNIIELFEQYWSNVPSDADIIFLGFQCLYGQDPYDESILSTISTKITDNVIKLNKMVAGNHAYAINRKSANKLLTHFIPTSNAIDKFPPEKFNIYAFTRPPFPLTTKEIVDDIFVDTAIWENNYPIIMYGLIGTRSEQSTIGHAKHHYMWFVDNEIS
ncbi:MAG: glycosyltransferase family 25, partial [Terrestrivirus sp.]